MPYLLDLTTKKLIDRFGVEDFWAREIENCYYKEWLETRSVGFCVDPTQANYLTSMYYDVNLHRN